MLRSHKTFLFDADGNTFKITINSIGTLWNSKGLIDGADRFLKYLKKTGRSVFLVTNNSTKSIEQYLQKCKRLGLDIEHVGRCFKFHELVRNHWLCERCCLHIVQKRNQGSLVRNRSRGDRP